ncbi:MAG: NAD(P)H-hydrate dehydratase [Ignavibacteria bacterium]|nr:NAD(P)H-hydrate dehydratase [Ignavibacteria bacterium]
MQNLYTSTQIKEIDNIAITTNKIPSQVLMENAATNITAMLRQYIKEKEIRVKKFAIVCSPGNNGGDGLAIARHLSTENFVICFFLGKKEDMTPETLVNFEAIEAISNIKVWFINKKNIETLTIYYDCIIDAMVGTGFEGPLRPEAAAVIEKINASKGLKVAIDVPTGFNSDSGYFTTETPIFKADVTFSVLGEKVGMRLNYKDFKPYGEVRVVPLATGVQLDQYCNNYLLDKNDVNIARRLRRPESHKYHYGRVVVIAGSSAMSGAAALVSNAAIKAGAGIVHLLSPTIHPAVLPEVISEVAGNGKVLTLHDLPTLEIECKQADAIVVGPGLSPNNETKELIHQLVEDNPDKQIIIDADGINAFTTDDVLSKNVTFTPHMGELANLIRFDEDIMADEEELNTDKLTVLKKVATKMNCNILLKGSTTLITDGETTYFNPFGNPGMATAGSGDVLSGILGATLAKNNNRYFHHQQYNVAKFVAFGSLWHSLAGDYISATTGEETLTASSLIDALHAV